MLKIYPHLCFDGQCEQAFTKYQKLFGGDIVTMMRYGESPMATKVDAQQHNKIIHASLLIGEVELAGADMLTADYLKPQGFFVIINIQDFNQAKATFSGLAEKGEVKMAFAETFWSKGFGVVIDRFNIPWEINCGEA
ncbi:VOC family protein [Alteromonadaceae bacterium BrNp21-10]|nr:VOC family protein [Alteromonadaceae bacterium BrNp21-10]